MPHPTADIDHLLKLTVDADKLQGVLRIEANSSCDLITRESLCAYLYGRDIMANCVLQEELDALIAEVKQDASKPHERLVVQGKKPVQGKDAQVEFTEEIQERFDRVAARHEAFLKAQEENALPEGGDEDGESEEDAIDFYNESTLVIVAKDQLVAHLHKHTPGDDGHTVYGIAIPAKPGKELEKLVDETCQINAVGEIHAQIDGHLTFENNKIRVHPALDIEGSIDFSTGNIDFPGDVTVSKGVRDRFQVKTIGSIEVQKLVEAAHLISSEDIILHQGMAGRDTGTINTVGNVTAGYLDGVHASITGNCSIKSEVTNCEIQVLGKIDAPTASIRGGELSIALGGSVGTLGSIQGVKTDVVLGQLREIDEKKRRALEFLPLIQSEIKKREKAVATIKGGMAKPNAEQETELWYMQSEIDTLAEKKDKLEMAIERLTEILQEHTHCWLQVMSMIYAKTELWLPGYHMFFERDVKGEFTIELNQRNDPVLVRGEHVEPLNKYGKLRPDDRVLPYPKPAKDQAA